jgi:surfactin synthase thioesterase subunit
MNENKSIKLFCLPFAGGSKYSFALFKRHLPEYIELIPLDIPGRGARFSEPLLSDMEALVEDLYAQIVPHVNSRYCFYGHSMGTLLAYLLTCRIQDENLNLPTHLFLSGRGGPENENTDRKWHALPSNEFRVKLAELGGSPQEVLDNDGLMEILEPILRADFKAVENFQYDQIRTFAIPVIVLHGLDDNFSSNQAQSWQVISEIPLNLHEFEGGHFFIFDHADKIQALFSTYLSTNHSNATLK